MSPTSESKDKVGVRAVKKQLKLSAKPLAVPSNGGNGAPASASDPVLATFHTLETAASVTMPIPQSNGRFRTIDEMEERSGSFLDTPAEYDSMSNNDSSSGESVKDQKEKTTNNATPQSDPIPVPGSDNDKRDKIRQKNERKHQRQREKRAQELHERCRGHLISWKLEALAQHLVAMGFPTERATMALILNEGRMEESVAWLLHDGEENKQHVPKNLESSGGVNLNIDISSELARFAEMETKYKLTKQEVERVVVSCEGDLKKAEDALKTHKQEPATATTSKLEESGDLGSGSHSSKLVTSNQNPMVRNRVKAVASLDIQEPRDERDDNYRKAGVVPGAMLQDSSNRTLQSLRRLQLNTPDWAQTQLAAASSQKWPSTSSIPASYVASPLPATVLPAKLESQYAVQGSEVVKRSSQTGALREPVIVMQRPESANANKQSPSSSIGNCGFPPASTGWYSGGITGSMGSMPANRVLGQNSSSVGLNGGGFSLQQSYTRNNFQHFVSSPVRAGATGWSDGPWNTTGSSSLSASASTLAAPSSLGLFTGWGSRGSSSGSYLPVDWNRGPAMLQTDYTCIDWSLHLTPLRPSLKSDTWSTMFMGGKPAMSPLMNGGGMFNPASQESFSNCI